MAQEMGKLSEGKKGIEISSDVADRIHGRKRTKAADNGNYSVVREFPTFILRMARAAFPNATNNTDALVAYLATMCPDVQDSSDFNKYVTDNQKDLIDDANTGVYSELSDRMLMVKKKLDAMANNDTTIKLLLYLLVADRYNLSTKLTDSTGFGSKHDLSQESLGPFMDELYALSTFFDKESTEFSHIKSRRDGRPMNF